jgi:lysozyme
MTPKTAAFVIAQEGLVLEWYKDSEEVGTWAGGVTDAAGVHVLKYKDNPQTIDVCLKATVELMQKKYLPAVLKAFGKHALNEAQLAAAVSFHWNTGRIGMTDWVTFFLEGKLAAAEKFLRSHYLNGGTLQGRRDVEADLFFHGTWPADLRAPVYPVRKPSYTPDFKHVHREDVMTALTKLLPAAQTA